MTGRRRWLVAGAGLLIVTAAIVSCATWLALRGLTAAPGEYAVPVRFGLFGRGPVVNVSVRTALRVALHPTTVAVLDGRTFATRHGTLHFSRVAAVDAATTPALTVDCTRCSVVFPGLGAEPVEVAAVQLTIAHDGDRVAGVVTAGDLRARYDAVVEATGVSFDVAVDRAPIVSWYRLIGDRIPELRTARIDGTASFAIHGTWPAATLAVVPVVEGFRVAGLGTESLAGRLADPADEGRSQARHESPALRLLGRAVVAAEDQRFYVHPGYDIAETSASLSRNVVAERVARGGSTIPQQLARILYVGSERSAVRKMRELLYAVEMERTLGKPRMLRLYLEVAPWGDGIRGADAAARRYYGVDADHLGAAQAVWLAAMLHAPDVERARWQARGAVDLVRATRVAGALGRTSKARRDRIASALAALPPPAGGLPPLAAR